MRKYDSKSKKEIAGLNEYELMRRIVYNVGRGPQFKTFEPWFDNKDKLKKDDICDCANGGMKIKWSDYGNNSKGKNYRWFLDREVNPDVKYELDTRISDDDEDYLGSYRPMRSPGIITINVDNIQVFFWSIICELACNQRYIFTREKIEELAYLCIDKTLYHELFHHFIDAQSYIVDGFSYNFDIDEALAVACSRLLVGFESKSNQAYVSDFYELAYSYNSRGYRDWINYKSDEQFLLKVIDYMPLNPRLKTMGQELLPIAEAMLYSIIENPNVKVEIKTF